MRFVSAETRTKEAEESECVRRSRLVLRLYKSQEQGKKGLGIGASRMRLKEVCSC